MSRRTGTRRRQAGFTLLELLVAVTLMSVLALLSWRGLEALISSRERITRASDELRALSMAFAQIENDLRRAWPVRLLDPGRPAVMLVDGARAGGLPGVWQLDLLREAPVLAASAPGGSDVASRGLIAAETLQHVIWRVVDGRLERAQSVWALPLAGSGAVQPAESPGASASSAELSQWTRQTILSDVQSFEWRLWLPGKGWVASGPTEGSGPAAVTGAEVSLVRSGERIVRTLAGRD